MSTPTLLKKSSEVRCDEKNKKGKSKPPRFTTRLAKGVVAKKRNRDIALFLNPQMREKFFKQRERERCEHERKNFEKLV